MGISAIAPTFFTGLARIPGDGRSGVPRAVRAFTPSAPVVVAGAAVGTGAGWLAAADDDRPRAALVGGAIGVGAALIATAGARLLATRIVGRYESTAALAAGGANLAANRGDAGPLTRTAPIPESFADAFRPMPATAEPLGPRDVGAAGTGSDADRARVAAVADSLLREPGVAFVATTSRDGTYELRAGEGVVRFRRWRDADGTVGHELLEHTGRVPFANADPRALATLGEEIAAAGGAGLPVRDELQHWPDLPRRMSAAFDHEDAPDLIYVPRGGAVADDAALAGARGGGHHGVPDVTQSRAALLMAGPGIAAGRVVDAPARLIDVAPTLADGIGVDRVDDVGGTFLRGQDGRSLLGELGAGGVADARRAERAILVVLDGVNAQVLDDELAAGRLPNLDRIARRGARFRHGALAEFPSVTWTNHASLLTGADPGRHGVLGNVWRDRERDVRHVTVAQGASRIANSSGLLDDRVETLYEAAARTFGKRTLTVAIGAPQGRGASYAPLDGAGIGRFVRDVPRTVREMRAGARAYDAVGRAAHPRYEGASTVQNVVTSTLVQLLDSGRDPKVAMIELQLTDDMAHLAGPQHDLARRALRESDRQVGRVLDALERGGRLDSTIVAVTSDHGSEHQSAGRAAGRFTAAVERGDGRAFDADGLVYLLD